MSVQYTYCSSNRGFGYPHWTSNKVESFQARPGVSNYTTKTSSTSSSSTSTPLRAQFLPEKSQVHRGMKTLVLDMDETLLHASTVPTVKPDFIARFSDGSKYYVLKRPHVDEFLERMSKLYEIVIFTAGEREYATTLINLLDPKRYISYILHRGHCLNSRGCLEKDLSLIGRDLRNVIFIDNLEENLRRQRDNGIKILDFYSNRRDEELKKLIPFLEYASTLDEVRPISKVHSDFLVKDLRNPETPKAKPRPEQNQGTGQRRRSIFEESPKVSGKDKLHASMTDFSKEVLGLTSIQEQSTTTSLNDLSLTSTPQKDTGRSEGKMKQISSERLTPSIGDVNIPSDRISIVETNSSTFSGFIASEAKPSKEIPYKRVVLEKETITFKREKEQGNLLSGSTASSSNDYAFRSASSQKLVNDLVGRINALEQRLKASQNYRNSSKQ